jgi:hypothetical protein
MGPGDYAGGHETLPLGETGAELHQVNFTEWTLA